MKIFWTKKRGWEIDVTIAGGRVREHGFSTKSAAEMFVAELKVQAKRGKYGLERDRPRALLSELIAERIKDLDERKATHRYYTAILRDFGKQFPVGFEVTELRTAHLRMFVQDRQRRAVAERREKLKAGTINLQLAVVSRMLRVAADLIPQLGEDWRPPRIPWERKGRRGRERIIGPGERSALLEALRFHRPVNGGRRPTARSVESYRDAADILELMLQTGMRSVEVRSTKWIEIDLQAAEVHLPKTKNREPRDVPLNSRALEILRRRYENRRSLFWAFPNAAATGPRSLESFLYLVRQAAERVGLHYGQKVEDGFTPHSARHTAATEMMRAGQDASAVQRVLGHSEQTMTLRYTHADRAGMRKAVDTLVLVPGASEPGGRQKVDKKKGSQSASRASTRK